MLRIGTRGSRLALAQAREVAGLLEESGHPTEVVTIVTAGDRGASPKHSPAGVKGLFVGEITDALARGDVDLAVHSAKDLPAEDPPGVVVAAVPERNLPYDVLVSRGPDVPAGSRVGTSSLRRQAQLRRIRPDLDVTDVRGNVDTRLRRMEEGRFDGLVLAGAGLARLGIQPVHAPPLPVDDMVPAPGQGALAVQAVAGSAPAEAAAAIDHPASRVAFEAERALVRLLGGGCRLPLGAYAERRRGGVRLLGVVIRPDGSDLLWSQVQAGSPEEAAGEAAEVLLAAGAAGILEEVRE
ncbi:MAG TPA: hydroxymethylbilane synthase [Actinomycetota bacterium]|nr:hydroxymethylbilane synthase [Actinomycetota bacterium]